MSIQYRFPVLVAAALTGLLPGVLAFNLPTAADEEPPLKVLMERWDKAVRTHLRQDEKLKRLSGKYPLVVLHSRHLYAQGDYKESAYSFSYETANPKLHHNHVEVLFHNGGNPKTFVFNMIVGQQNLVVDLGPVDFEKDPKPA